MSPARCGDRTALHQEACGRGGLVVKHGSGHRRSFGREGTRAAGALNSGSTAGVGLRDRRGCCHGFGGAFAAANRLAEALDALPELERAAIALSLEKIVDLMEIGQVDASPILDTGVSLKPTFPIGQSIRNGALLLGSPRRLPKSLMTKSVTGPLAETVWLKRWTHCLSWSAPPSRSRWRKSSI